MTYDDPTTLVLVDASPDFRWLVRRVLQRKGGFDVVADTHDSTDGLELAALFQPDVVLLDVDDQQDAGALVRPFRISCPQATIIATVSLGREAVRGAVLDAGGAGVVRKHVTVQHTFDQLWSILAPVSAPMNLATD